MANILLFGEITDKEISSITYELLSASNKLKVNEDDKVIVALLGDVIPDSYEDLFSYGAQAVCLVSDHLLRKSNLEIFL